MNQRMLLVVMIPVIILVTHMLSDGYASRKFDAKMKETGQRCPPTTCEPVNTSSICPPITCPTVNVSCICPPTTCPPVNTSINCPQTECKTCPTCSPAVETSNSSLTTPPEDSASPRRLLRTSNWTEWIDERAEKYYLNRQIMEDGSEFIEAESPLCVPAWSVTGADATISSGDCIQKPTDTFASLRGSRIVLLGDAALLHIITTTMEQSPEIKSETDEDKTCWIYPQQDVTMCIYKVQGREVTRKVLEVTNTLQNGDLLVVMIGSLYDRASLAQFAKVETDDQEVALHEGRARQLMRQFAGLSDEGLITRLHADTSVTLLRTYAARKRGVEVMWVTPLPRYLLRESYMPEIDGVHFESRLVKPISTCSQNYSSSFAREHAIATALEDIADIIPDDPIAHIVDVSSAIRVLSKDVDTLEGVQLTRGPDGFPECFKLKKGVAQGVGNMIFKGISDVMRSKKAVDPGVSGWISWMTTESRKFWADREAVFPLTSPLCKTEWEYQTEGNVAFRVPETEHFKFMGLLNTSKEEEKTYLDHNNNYNYCPFPMRATGCQDDLVKLLDCMDNQSAVWFIGDSTMTLPYLRLLGEGVSGGISPKQQYNKVKGGVKSRLCNTVHSKDMSKEVYFCLFPGGGRVGPRSMIQLMKGPIGETDVVVVMLGTHYNVWNHHDGKKDQSTWSYEREAAATMPSWVPDKYHSVYSRLAGDINEMMKTYKTYARPLHRLVWVTPLPQFFHLEGNLSPAAYHLRSECRNTSQRLGMAREYIVSQALRQHADTISHMVDFSTAIRSVDGNIIPTVTSSRVDCSHPCVDVNAVLGKMLIRGVCEAKAKSK